MQSILIVDRIEGEFALCEDGDRRRVKLPLDRLPPDIREGDCLRRTDTGYAADPDETRRRRQKNTDLFRRLLGEPPE